MNWFQLLYTPTLPNKTNCFIRNFQRVNDKYFFIQIHDPYNAPALSISRETKPETLVNLQLTINPRRSAAVPNRGRTFCSFVSASPLSLKPKLFQPAQLPVWSIPSPAHLLLLLVRPCTVTAGMKVYILSPPTRKRTIWTRCGTWVYPHLHLPRNAYLLLLMLRGSRSKVKNANQTPTRLAA